MPADVPTAAGGPVPEPGGGAGIQLSGIGKRFGEVTALRGIGLTVARHSRTGVVGPSGGGKSTLLQIVAGLMEPDTGTVTVEGAGAARDRLARCALMPQRDLLLPWRSALDNATLALENRGVPRARARQAIRPLFARFGLAGFEQARPGQLSGGMRQRVGFLRTLAAGKDVLLLDEPFGALDSITRAGMQEWLLRALAAEPRTVLLVTHDVEEALLLCGTVVVLSARPGQVVRVLSAGFPADAPRREVVTSPGFVALREEALAAIG